MRPPVPLRARPVLELANFVTVGLLPPRLRRKYGFSWDPARAVVLRGGAEYAKRFVVPFLPERLRVVRSARRAGVGAKTAHRGEENTARVGAPNVGSYPLLRGEDRRSGVPAGRCARFSRTRAATTSTPFPRCGSKRGAPPPALIK